MIKNFQECKSKALTHAKAATADHRFLDPRETCDKDPCVSMREPEQASSLFRADLSLCLLGTAVPVELVTWKPGQWLLG